MLGFCTGMFWKCRLGWSWERGKLPKTTRDQNGKTPRPPGTKREKGKGGRPVLLSFSTRQPDRAYAHTNETKRFPGWAPPNLRFHIDWEIGKHSSTLSMTYNINILNSFSFHFRDSIPKFSIFVSLKISNGFNIRIVLLPSSTYDAGIAIGDLGI